MPGMSIQRSLGSALWLLLATGCAFTDMREIQNKPITTRTQPVPEIPYQVQGVTYYPLKDATGFVEEGVASWYGPNFHGKLTSNKEVYNMNAMTAAHRTLPFNSLVKVVNMGNGMETMVRINDRGPFAKDRIIDLSYKAAKKLGIVENGTALVKLIVVTPGNGGGNDPGPTPPYNNNGNNYGDKANLSPQDNYSIQVAVFRDPDNANRAGQQIESGRVKPFTLEGETYYRVLVGSVADFERAIKLRDEVRRQGYPKAFIVSVSNN